MMTPLVPKHKILYKLIINILSTQKFNRENNNYILGLLLLDQKVTLPLTPSPAEFQWPFRALPTFRQIDKIVFERVILFSLYINLFNKNNAIKLFYFIIENIFYDFDLGYERNQQIV